MKKINSILTRFAMSISVFAMVISSFGMYSVVYAEPVSTLGVPDQSSCEAGGSTTYRWDNLDDGAAVERPVITSMSVKASSNVSAETISDPTDPEIGSIGATICPNVALGRRTGLTVYTKTVAGNDINLSDAVTPSTSSPITENSEITITISAGDMGDLAPYYSFSLIHGYVVNWVTSGLGTANAALSVTLKPVRTPYGSGEQFNFCTATPPNCNANKSDVDVLSASLDMTFTTVNEGTVNEDWEINGNYSEMRGSYFGMTGAMGGWAEAIGPGGQPRSVRASLGAPHYLADGTTLNVGSLQAFMPDSVIETIFETTADNLSEETISVTRTEEGFSEGAPFTITSVEGGVVVGMDNVTFSSPQYTISIAGQNGGEQPEDTDTSKYLTLSNGTLANLETLEGTVISNFEEIDINSLLNKDVGYSYPLGLFGFTFSAPTGSTQTVSLSILTDLPADEVVVRKYNTNTNSFSTIANAQVTEQFMGDERVVNITYEITDGGELDQDGQVNGIIVDPVGPAISSVGAPNTGIKRP